MARKLPETENVLNPDREQVQPVPGRLLGDNIREWISQEQFAFLKLELHFPDGDVAQIQPVLTVPQSLFRRRTQTATVPPNEGTGVEKEIHAGSNMEGKFRQGRIEVRRGLHRTWMQGRNAALHCLGTAQGPSGGLPEVFPEPLLQGLFGRERSFRHHPG